MRRAVALALLLAMPIAAGVPGVAAGTPPVVEVIGGPRPEVLDRLVGVLQELGLRFPSATRVYIYGSRPDFRRGIVEDAGLSDHGADELARFAVGLARPGRVLLNGRLSNSGSEWLRLVAHELTHVAFQVLERMSAGALERHRKVALRRARGQAAVAQSRLDLATLGSPRQFTLRHQREGSTATYHLTFLLADYLIQREGFDKVLEYFGRLRSRSSATAFAATFGQTLQDFEREVLPYLKRAMAEPDLQQP